MTPPCQPDPRYRQRQNSPQPYDPQQVPQWQQPYYPPRPVPKASAIRRALRWEPRTYKQAWLFASGCGLFYVCASSVAFYFVIGHVIAVGHTIAFGAYMSVCLGLGQSFRVWRRMRASRLPERGGNRRH
jgi:hypothetical protein